MTIAEIITLSAIEDCPNYLTHDYAVPIGTDGKYPHGGKAIAIYFQDRSMEIVSYIILIRLALQNIKSVLSPINFRTLNHSQIYKYVDAYINLSNELIETGPLDDYRLLESKLMIKP